MQAVVLVVESVVLQLQVLKFLILAIGVALEQFCQIVHPFAYFLMQFLELGFGALFKFLELHLELALLFALGLE